MTGAHPLSDRLRVATRGDHVETERTPFMGRLLRGQASVEEYVAYLACLRSLYEALEGTLPEMPQWVRDLHGPGLMRLAVLSRDLEDLAEGEPPAPAPAARALGARIRALQKAPHLWVAHAWVRYMGDLSGGQVVAGIVRKTYGLQGDRGTAFYAFPGIDDPAAFKARYREGLDAAPLTAVEVEGAAAEARRAFAAHRDFLAQLTA